MMSGTTMRIATVAGLGACMASGAPDARLDRGAAGDGGTQDRPQASEVLLRRLARVSAIARDDEAGKSRHRGFPFARGLRAACAQRLVGQRRARRDERADGRMAAESRGRARDTRSWGDEGTL